jgi:drug/metabolite transporter (DMT)-like permease
MNGTGLRQEFRDDNAANAGRIRTSGALTMIGGALLTVGAILIDLGWRVDLPAIASLGNALAALSGLGLLFLPLVLRASRLGGTGILATVGTASLVIGICLASVVDVPAILDPSDLEAGGAMGPIGLLLLSIGFLAWFVSIRRTSGLAG